MSVKCRFSGILGFAWLSVGLTLVPVPAAQASLIARDDFESQSLGTINGQGGGTGFTGTYFSDNAPAANIVSSSLSYSNGLAGETGGSQALAITFNAASNGVDNGFLGRTFAVNPTALSTVYFSFLFNANNVASNEFVQVGVSNNASGTASEPKIAVGVAQQTPGTLTFFGRMPGGSATQFSTVPFSANTTYLVVGKVSNVAGTGSADYNRLDLFVNPNSANEPSPSFTINTTDSTINTLSSFNVRVARIASGDKYTLDNALIGSSFADVVPTPEPVSLASLGLGGLLLMMRRRHTAKGRLISPAPPGPHTSPAGG